MLLSFGGTAMRSALRLLRAYACDLLLTQGVRVAKAGEGRNGIEESLGRQSHRRQNRALPAVSANNVGWKPGGRSTGCCHPFGGTAMRSALRLLDVSMETTKETFETARDSSHNHEEF